MTLHPARNPVHIYRACLRECSYLPLPKCRSFMKEFVTHSFRHWIPKSADRKGRSPSGRWISFPTQTKLLHRARRLCSTLTRANEGYTDPLTRILRMSYGRSGPRRAALLDRFTARGFQPEEGGAKEVREKDGPQETLQDVASRSKGDTLEASLAGRSSEDEDLVERYSKEWEPPAHFLALVKSQSAQQHTFSRAGSRPKLKVKFSPPATDIWGRPLPRKRYKNLKIKWYKAMLAAALPPLPESEYKELHAIVSGASEFPAPLPRRTRILHDMSKEDAERAARVEMQSSLILEGPKPGPRLKDLASGRPHNLTPRLLRRLLSRVVLQQTPLVRVVEPSTPNAKTARLVFHWDDGLTVDKTTLEKLVPATTSRQSDLLFN